MEKKRLLLLGGLRFLIPVIKEAHKMGIHVITCDNVENNIAHKYSDEYYNVSIIDKEAVLDLSRKLKIDGIMSFAVDPGVVTASYVAEELGLSGVPYSSVQILQNKDLFRKYLLDNNFNVPYSMGFDNFSISEKDLIKFKFPIIVKPVDSAGSKGVTKVTNYNELESAVEIAFSKSISGRIIIEEYIEAKDYSSDSDCFSVDSKMVFTSFNKQYFDKNSPNPYTPSSYSWPSSFSNKQEDYLRNELNRLVSSLNLGTSIFNVETRINSEGIPYIMEVAPRGGGNRLSEMVYKITGTNLIKNSILASLGENEFTLTTKNNIGFWAEIILHSNKSGLFDKVEIDDEILEKYIDEVDLWVGKGDFINDFNAANDTIGTLVLKFDSQEKLDQVLSTQNEWMKIIVD